MMDAGQYCTVTTLMFSKPGFNPMINTTVHDLVTVPEEGMSRTSLTRVVLERAERAAREATNVLPHISYSVIFLSIEPD